MTEDVPQNSAKKIGTVRIAPGILLTVVAQAVKDVEGVVRTVEPPSSPGGIDRLFSRNLAAPGLRIAVDDGKVNVELYIVARRSANMRNVGEAVRAEVSRALRHIVGMPVGHINVHIQDVE